MAAGSPIYLYFVGLPPFVIICCPREMFRRYKCARPTPSSGLFNTDDGTNKQNWIYRASLRSTFLLFLYQHQLDRIWNIFFFYLYLSFKISFPASPQLTRTATHYCKVGYDISSSQCRHTGKCDLFPPMVHVFVFSVNESESTPVFSCLFSSLTFGRVPLDRVSGRGKDLVFLLLFFTFKGLMPGTCYSPSDFRMALNQFSIWYVLRMHVSLPFHFFGAVSFPWRWW